MLQIEAFASSRIARPLASVVAEAGLFEPEGFDDQSFGAQKLRIGLAHLARERGNELPHQGLRSAEKLRMAHGAAHDPAQHITAPLVRGQDAIGDEEGGSAQDGRR